MTRSPVRGAHRAPGRAVIDYRGLARPVGRTVGGVAAIGAVATGAALHSPEAANAAMQSAPGAHAANRLAVAHGAARSTTVIPEVTLRPGARGEAVRQLQTRLNQNGASINVDGIFGSATTRAVRAYQSSKGLRVDGIVGIRTRTALNGAAAAPATAAPAAPATSTAMPKLRRGDRGAAVETLQKQLNDRGASIAVDGIFGSGTADAVRALQRAAGIGVDAIVGPKTWNALQGNASAAPQAPSAPRSEDKAPSTDQPKLRYGSRGAAVKTLQSLLNDRGASIAVDGIFGSGTKNAVRALQSAAGIGVDGIVGPKTWAAATSSVRLPSGAADRSNDRSAPPVSGGATSVPISDSTFNAEAIISAARAQIGKPYVWGASSPSVGFDCSGLVTYAYRSGGVDTPRLTARGFTFAGKIIPRSEAQPGDLVSFTANNYGHIGIYLGDGRIIDASGSRRGVVERTLWNAPHVFVTFR